MPAAWEQHVMGKDGVPCNSYGIVECSHLTMRPGNPDSADTPL